MSAYEDQEGKKMKKQRSDRRKKKVSGFDGGGGSVPVNFPSWASSGGWVMISFS
jgi:hypothetical protein